VIICVIAMTDSSFRRVDRYGSGCVRAATLTHPSLGQIYDAVAILDSWFVKFTI
jgi:hypothetical protein